MGLRGVPPPWLKPSSFVCFQEERKLGAKSGCFRPVSNRGPFACEANVITTTLRKRDARRALTPEP